MPPGFGVGESVVVEFLSPAVELLPPSSPSATWAPTSGGIDAAHHRHIRANTSRNEDDGGAGRLLVLLRAVLSKEGSIAGSFISYQYFADSTNEAPAGRVK
mmetsp:Transcript_5206/g.15029  ORF Transcript_5206/g.15029 Transcript_5206/m.15029 type:complete len:101 (-) Transcript_5206:368-670(-)